VHPPYQKPELLATAPNQLWSWDITKLRGPVQWTYFYLYVILDVFTRYVTGWMVANRESAELATRLIEATVLQHNVPPGQLNIHADRGRVMLSKPVAFLMSDLGVTKTHSRPYVSDDNPYSESQFRTLKYRPDFPDRFGCLPDARAFCQQFFAWYQRRTSPLWARTAHSCHGALRPRSQRPGSTPDRSRRGLLGSPRAFRASATYYAPATIGGLDQQARQAKDRTGKSLNSLAGCLKIVDTRRWQHEHQHIKSPG
jgi:hypothetical protein